jgi:hypothetical protein
MLHAGGLKKKTWKVLEWDKIPDNSIGLICPECGTEAEMPTHGRSPPIIAAIGLRLILDHGNPPDSFLPAAVMCRYCRMIFVSKSDGNQ